MWKWILLVLLAIVGGLAAFIASRPSHFEVTRSTSIDAPPAAVFEQVNEFKKWGAWDPWAKLDPNAKKTFEGPALGVGSKMSWNGNADLGEGTITIVDSNAPEAIKLKLEFKRPMQMACDELFTFVPEPNGKTKVTWKMSGERGFLEKAGGLIFDCEKIVGPDFEKGLATLKIVVEAPSSSPDATRVP